MRVTEFLFPGFRHEKGDWLDEMIGEMEASVQGHLNPAKIIAMEELPLMSELCEVNWCSKPILSIPGKRTSGSTLLCTSLFPPLLGLY